MGIVRMLNEVVKVLRRSAVYTIPLIFIICLIGCERKTTTYREIDITETVSGQEGADVNEQEVFAKGYNLWG